MAADEGRTVMVRLLQPYHAHICCFLAAVDVFLVTSFTSQLLALDKVFKWHVTLTYDSSRELYRVFSRSSNAPQRCTAAV